MRFVDLNTFDSSRSLLDKRTQHYMIHLWQKP